MLEIRNVTKIYKSKSGAVKALDNVSITFPETGMVFVLGKSGSGKSTLLNVIGGLDGCDSGEFIIKGKSSKSFGGSDFDAYRNTFIGFIFQEYNILDDFTVGANIGLALELQGKKATSKKISEILGQVELLNYAKRKPNELSGGQKQRIAIARALVKDPEIIMADEPTGALDSNTGKQIFDTLKELSRTKLVIVVSHDRDFAEKYGDRIIEMKDGQILSDVTKHQIEAKPLSEGILQMSDHLLRIEKGYQLTARDVEMINEYLREQPSEILISGDERLNSTVRSSAGISESNTASVFNDTDPETDVPVKDYSGTKTKFIRSRLPMKNALKMGSSSLGHKKFRLVMTIFLSLIAFALFGFADTLGAYDKVVAATDSIQDSNIQNASFSLSVKHSWIKPNGKEDYFYHMESAMNQKDLESLQQKTGIEFIPVFNGTEYSEGSQISLTHMMQKTDQIAHGTAYTGNLYGFTPAGSREISQLQFPVVGELPDKEDEIAITEFLYRQWNLTGFVNETHNESVKAGELTTDTDGSKNSIIGKHLTLRVFDMEHTFVVTGVIDTGFDYGRYEKYVPTADDEQNTPMGNENMLVDMLMQQELANTLNYGFHGLGYITQKKLDEMARFMVMYRDPTESIGTYMQWDLQIYQPDGGSNYIGRVGQSSDLKLFDKGGIQWFDGKERDKLGKDEILLPTQFLSFGSIESDYSQQWNTVMSELYGENWYSLLDGGYYSLPETVRIVALESYMNEHFASARAELVENYKEVYGTDATADWELKNFWRECLQYNHQFLPANCPTESEIVGDAYRTVYTKLLGITADAKLPDSFYRNMLERLWYQAEENKLILNASTMQEILIFQYAYSRVVGNPSFYESEQFLTLALKDNIDMDYWESLEAKDTATKEELAANAYFSYMTYTVSQTGVNQLDSKTYAELASEGQSKYFALTGDSFAERLKDLEFKATDWYNDGALINLGKFKVVGLINTQGSLVISDSLYERHEEYRLENELSKEVVEPHEMGIYAFAIAPMPTDEATIRKLVEISFDESQGLRFTLQNQVMNTLSGFNEFIEIGAKVFLYIGLGFALFSALMLMNFISVSISYKRREIGILRAVGARSSDVFKIFFCEAFIIALINYILSVIATVVATTAFNILVRSEGINVTLLHFGIRQIVLMFLISLVVAAVASFLPVWNIARRKPIDAIKNK